MSGPDPSLADKPMTIARRLVGGWERLMRSHDQTDVRTTLDGALSFTVSTELVVRIKGADTVRAAAVRCYPTSLPGETLRLHHVAARISRPETLKYLMEEVGGFPADERTVGPGRMSLLHLAVIPRGDDEEDGMPAPDEEALQERRLACVRYLVEEQGLSPLVRDGYGNRPVDYVEAGELGMVVRQYLLLAAARMWGPA